jgi:GT2 family glycosyltransferase
MPRFSVIIPAYNRAGTIGAALDSVFAQSFGDYEVIVVDDGSTDETPEVVARFGPRVRLVRQANRGQGTARNTGIAHATGEYVTFLDSDDVWFPWTLSVYDHVTRDHGDPSFVAGTLVDFHHLDELAGVTACPPESRWYADYFAASREAFFIQPGAAAVRADALRVAGGFATFRYNFEENHLWLRLGTAPGFVRVLTPPVAGYRHTPGSAVSHMERTFRGGLAVIANERAGCYPGGRERARDRRRVITRHVRAASLALLASRDWSRAARLYSATLGWHVRLGRVRYLFGFPLLALAAPWRHGGRPPAGGPAPPLRPTAPTQAVPPARSKPL